MNRIVLDTNCLLQIIPLRSPFRFVWDSYRSGIFHICVSNEILSEYMEILSRVANADVASNIVNAITNSPNTEFYTPHFKFGIITEDPDDNKFVDCAIVAQAKCIVSNDRHFDAVRTCPFPSVTVQSLAEFAQSLQ